MTQRDGGAMREVAKRETAQSPPPQPWLIVMFSLPPRSISMKPVVGGVAHYPINEVSEAVV
jgi:hypothetical protein